MKIRTGIGQDSHRFDTKENEKPLKLGGVIFKGYPGLAGNSDADVVLHAVTNAISGVTGINILGDIADKMCLTDGIKDSGRYLNEAMKYMGSMSISHVSISIECLKPKISPLIPEMRNSIAGLIGLNKRDICITATSGERLTDFGKGLGIQATCIVTVIEA